MSDYIDRQAAIAAITDELMPSTPLSAVIRAKNRLKELPSVQPDHTADIGKKVCVDTISRQAAIDMLDEQIELCNKALCSFYISPKDEYAIKVERASLKAYKEQLGNMLSAQPERNGKWIYNSPTTMKCDRCGFAIKDWDWHRFKYCPNCGARMKGGEEK